MADAYSDLLGLIKIEEGTHSNEWGDLLNLNFDRIEGAIRGYKAIALSGAESLDAGDITATGDTAKQESFFQFIEFTGTGGTVTVPAEDIFWIVYNNTGGDFTFQPSGGTGVTLTDGKVHFIVYGSNGTTFTDVTTLFSGLINISGTPANNQVGIWTDADTLEGDSGLTFDGTDLTTTGGITVGSNVLSDTDSTDSLGTTGVRWAATFTDALTVTDNATVGGTLGVTGALTATAGITSGSDIVSDTDSTDSLGTTGVRWAATFTDAVTVTNNGTIGGTLGVTGALTATAGITSGSDIVSDTDSTDDLGTTGVRWANTFTDAITVTNNITAGGTITDGSGIIYPRVVLQDRVDLTTNASVGATGIPSWATRITVVVEDLSTTSSNVPYIQIGDSGGYETSGYIGCSSRDAGNSLAHGTGWYLESNWSDAIVLSGMLTIERVTEDIWVCTGGIGLTSSAINVEVAGLMELTGAGLDRILIHAGAGTFDGASTWTVRYE